MNGFSELHLHIEGTLEPEFLLELSRRNGVPLETADLDELRKLYNFTDLQDFLNLYYQSMATLKTAEDYTELANRYFERVHKTGLVRVEAFFDPQSHNANGNNFATVFGGLSKAFSEAESRYGVTGRLIMCFERDRGANEANRTFDEMLEYFDLHPNKELLIGVGLDSAEAPFPPAPFKEVYERARNFGLNLTAHAGEEGGPDYIWSALDDLGVQRIDHGVRAIEDQALLRRLAVDEIPLTVCPLSNYALKVVDSVESSAKTILQLLDKGVVVTINSDDPAYFGGYIDDNYAALARCGLGDDAIDLLKANSLKAVF
jgi:adenosine deaminase